MDHTAREIIRMINFLKPLNNQIKQKNIFILDKDGGKFLKKDNLYKLQPNAKEEIKKHIKGYVSYLRSVNPYTFPKRVEVGVIPTPIDLPKSEYMKYTKVIRCPMTKIQYLTYIENFQGKLPQWMKHMLNMVFPHHDESKSRYF